MGWFDSPKYLKGIQKIKSMGPEDRAVTQTLIDELSSLYAGADMQKQLSAMRAGTQKTMHEDQLKSKRQRLDTSRELSEREMALAEKDIEYNKDAAREAEILGWGNIGLSGLFGYQDMKQKKKMADWYAKMDKYHQDFMKRQG
jgi:hypothetical protein